MHAKLTKSIVDFKLQNAEILAWIYDFCRTQDEPRKETRQDVIQFCKMLDLAETSKASDVMETKLVEFIRRTRGIKPMDNEILAMSCIFPHDTERASSIMEKVGKFISIDLGDIEELFEKIITGIAAIRAYLVRYYKEALKNGSTLLERIDIILESLKKLKSDTHLLIHIQTRLEMVQLHTRAA